MKNTNNDNELPLDISDDYLFRGFVDNLNKNINALLEVTAQGIRDPIDYHQSVGRLWGLTYAKNKLLELAKAKYKESEDN